MLVAYLIMLREGIEAALIVGIIASYLKQTGRSRWMPSIWLGVVLAATICFVVGILLNLASAEFPQKQQELFAGIVALIAAGMLTSMVFWMKKAARSIKGTLHRSIDDALVAGDRQGLALVAMAFLAVGREGIESVFFLLATFQQDVGYEAPAGALLGIASAVAVGAAVTYGGVKIDLRRFFRWTGLLILLVAAGLLAAGLKAFHEAGIWNGLQSTAFDLSALLPADGVAGTLLAGLFGYQDAPSVGAVVLYLAFLVPAVLVFLARGRAAPSTLRRPDAPASA